MFLFLLPGKQAVHQDVCDEGQLYTLHTEIVLQTLGEVSGDNAVMATENKVIIDDIVDFGQDGGDAGFQMLVFRVLNISPAGAKLNQQC